MTNTNGKHSVKRKARILLPLFLILTTLIFTIGASAIAGGQRNGGTATDSTMSDTLTNVPDDSVGGAESSAFDSTGTGSGSGMASNSMTDSGSVLDTGSAGAESGTDGMNGTDDGGSNIIGIIIAIIIVIAVILLIIALIPKKKDK